MYTVGLSAAAFSRPAEQLQLSRKLIYEALVAGKVLNPGRSIFHLAHACSLNIDARWYPVIDLGEGVRESMTVSGVNTIVVLTPDLKVVQKIGYATERPLYCVDNALYVFGDLTIDGIVGQGNVLVFHSHGKEIELRELDVTKMPFEPSGVRSGLPQ